MKKELLPTKANGNGTDEKPVVEKATLVKSSEHMLSIQESGSIPLIDLLNSGIVSEKDNDGTGKNQLPQSTVDLAKKTEIEISSYDLEKNLSSTVRNFAADFINESKVLHKSTIQDIEELRVIIVPTFQVDIVVAMKRDL